MGKYTCFDRGFLFSLGSFLDISLESQTERRLGKMKVSKTLELLSLLAGIIGIGKVYECIFEVVESIVAAKLVRSMLICGWLASTGGVSTRVTKIAIMVKFSAREGSRLAGYIEVLKYIHIMNGNSITVILLSSQIIHDFELGAGRYKYFSKI